MYNNTVVDRKHAMTAMRQATVAINYDIGIAYIYILDHACKNTDFMEFVE